MTVNPLILNIVDNLFKDFLNKFENDEYITLNHIIEFEESSNNENDLVILRKFKILTMDLAKEIY